MHIEAEWSVTGSISEGNYTKTGRDTTMLQKGQPMFIYPPPCHLGLWWKGGHNAREAEKGVAPRGVGGGGSGAAPGGGGGALVIPTSHVTLLWQGLHGLGVHDQPCPTSTGSPLRPQRTRSQLQQPPAVCAALPETPPAWQF